MSRFSSLEFGETPEPSAAPRIHANPRGVERFLTEAREFMGRGLWDRALRACGRVMEEDAACVEAWVLHLRALLEMDDAEAANDWADKALERAGRRGALLALKAAALARRGDREEALALSDESMAGGREDPWRWLARAEVLLARGDPAAATCFEEAAQRSGGDWMLSWIAARGWMRHGRHATALPLLREACSADATRPAVWVSRGECEAALGHLDAARKAFQQALDLNADTPGAREGLARLHEEGWGMRLAGAWRRLTGR